MFTTLKSVLGDVFAGTIKDQRISLSLEQAAALEREIIKLRSELAASALEASKFKAESRDLHKKLELLQPAGFVEHMGAFWKRTKDGFEPLPYCKFCEGHPIMGRPRGQRFYLCGTGDHHAPLSIHPPENEEG